eukprot:g2659.t1
MKDEALTRKRLADDAANRALELAAIRRQRQMEEANKKAVEEGKRTRRVGGGYVCIDTSKFNVNKRKLDGKKNIIYSAKRKRTKWSSNSSQRRPMSAPIKIKPGVWAKKRQEKIERSKRIKLYRVYIRAGMNDEEANALVEKDMLADLEEKNRKMLEEAMKKNRRDRQMYKQLANSTNHATMLLEERLRTCPYKVKRSDQYLSKTAERSVFGGTTPVMVPKRPASSRARMTGFKRNGLNVSREQKRPQSQSPRARTRPGQNTRSVTGQQIRNANRYVKEKASNKAENNAEKKSKKDDEKIPSPPLAVEETKPKEQRKEDVNAISNKISVNIETDKAPVISQSLKVPQTIEVKAPERDALTTEVKDVINEVENEIEKRENNTERTLESPLQTISSEVCLRSIRSAEKLVVSTEEDKKSYDVEDNYDDYDFEDDNFEGSGNDVVIEEQANYKLPPVEAVTAASFEDEGDSLSAFVGQNSPLQKKVKKKNPEKSSIDDEKPEEENEAYQKRNSLREEVMAQLLEEIRIEDSKKDDVAK